MVEGVTASTSRGDTLRVREVWASNLEEEMHLIRSVVDAYPLIAMDTEFPGIVAKPLGRFKSSGAYHYETLRCNVDMLKLIQLGLTLSDANGNLPRSAQDDNELCVWQFNFREFDLEEDIHSTESIELLKTSGIDFERMKRDGIDVHKFGEMLMVSGVVLNERVRWITFHSAYDFGYLMKVLTCKPLPEDEADFFDVWKLFFPRVYDIKYLMKHCDGLHGGLNKVAEILHVDRIGPQHQAGSDSLLTLYTFLKMVKTHFGGAKLVMRRQSNASDVIKRPANATWGSTGDTGDADTSGHALACEEDEDGGDGEEVWKHCGMVYGLGKDSLPEAAGAAALGKQEPIAMH